MVILSFSFPRNFPRWLPDDQESRPSRLWRCHPRAEIFPPLIQSVTTFWLTSSCISDHLLSLTPGGTDADPEESSAGSSQYRESAVHKDTLYSLHPSLFLCRGEDSNNFLQKLSALSFCLRDYAHRLTTFRSARVHLRRSYRDSPENHSFFPAL